MARSVPTLQLARVLVHMLPHLRITAAALSPDERTLAVGASGGRLLVAHVDLRLPDAHLRTIAGATQRTEEERNWLQKQRMFVM